MTCIPDNLEIVVIGNRRKKIITTDFLTDIPHRVFYTTDYDLPENMDIDSSLIQPQFQIGAYRCFRGHQDAIASCTKDYILVFEDDAVVKIPTWIDYLIDGISLLNEFDIVSFHNRVCTFSSCDKITINRHRYYYPIKDDFWCTATLSYMIKKETKKNICDMEYNGTPIDITYIRKFKFCFSDPSPFYHDRRHGSLIDDFK